MPARHSHRSIRPPFTGGIRDYLIGKDVVMIPASAEQGVITYEDDKASRVKVANVDTRSETLILFVPQGDRKVEVRFEYHPRLGCWKHLHDYSYFDIQTAPTAQAELPASPPQEPVQTETTTEALAEMIALIHEEMQNARGEIVLRNLDRSALLKAKRATEYLHRLIALSLELADLRASDLSRKDIQAVVDRALKDFKDHIEDPRISSG